MSPRIEATDYNDNLYLTWRIVYSLEEAQANLFKITAEHPGAHNTPQAPLLGAIILSILIAAVVFCTAGESVFIRLIVVAMTVFAVLGVTWSYTRESLIKQPISDLQETIELYTDFIRDCQSSLHEISFIPPEYWKSEILYEFYSHMETGRAESILEAISVREKAKSARPSNDGSQNRMDKK